MRELFSFLKEENFSIIHANAHFVAPYAVKMGRKFGIPVLTHIRALLTPDKVRKYSILESDLVICNSYSTRERIKNIPPHKLRVVYNGIDTDYFSPQPEEKILRFRKKWGVRGKYVVGYLGKISRDKGLDILLSILPVLKSRGVEVVVGGEVRREKDRDLLEGLRKGGAILTGWVRDLPLFYSSLDLFFFPTREESFGRVAVEAQACGIPVVGCRTGGVREVVREGETGFLFMPEDTEGALRKIFYVLENPSLKEKMGRRGREWVRRKFSLTDKVREIEEIYLSFQE